MASASDAETRKLRVGRLKSFQKDLSAEREPRTDRGTLLQLIQDLKDEGNQLFKENHFDKAAIHYKNALFVAHTLEDRFYHEVEVEFMTTLYSNGSLSYLKLNKFQDALEYSENALRLQPDNLKARYRKAQALEGLKRYKEALKEAKEGVKLQPSAFKPFVAKLEEVLGANRSSATKSATASATNTLTSSQAADSSNEWLAETNALKTEKQRKAVLDKMPKNKKKKGKVPQPIVSPSSESDSDSDSSEQSSEDSPESSSSSKDQKRNQPTKGKPPGKTKANVVRVKASEPDPNADVLAQRSGFTQVGATSKKNQSSSAANGMGLDTFGIESDMKVTKPKSKPQTASAPKLPPVNVTWPLEEAFQFRLVCKTCFVKTGEGYKGYNYIPTYSHKCEKNVLIIRRRDNSGLNWIKIRPFPELINNKFSEFKMCQQFVSAQPCKIGEVRCTFPHNKHEMHLWYMEVEGDFCYAEFMEALRKNNITTSEELAARRPPEKAAAQHIPGLNFKTGARQRLSSPAPLAESTSKSSSANKASQQPASAPKTSTPPPASVPPSSAAPANGSSVPSSSSKPVKTGLLGNGPQDVAGTPAPLFAFKPADQSTAPQPVPASSQLGDNVLKDFEYKILCPACFPFDNFPGRYCYAPCTHECAENVLAVKQKNKPKANWERVRERRNHREFSGNYVMCYSVVTGDRDQCRFGELNCSFAHSEAEQQIWALEKMGKFSIVNFIHQNRHALSSRTFSLDELLKKHGGFFTFICRACFYGRPPVISEAAPYNTCAGIMRHRWDMTRILAHMSNKVVTPIEPRKLVEKNAFFRFCRFLHYCPDLVSGACLSAHSYVERDVWMLERDTDISRLQLVQESQGVSRPFAEQHPRQQGVGGTNPPQSMPAGPAASGPAPQTQTRTAGEPDSQLPKVPYTVREFCGLCWSNGTRSLEDNTSNRCVKGHSNFKIKRVFLIVGIYRELRSLPSVIPRNLNFAVCRFIQQKKKCQYVGQGPCQFAHSEEEKELWFWMAKNKVTKLEDVVKQCLEDTKLAKINKGDSVVTASNVKAVPPIVQVRLPTDLQNSAHYCRYCSVQSNSERQWEEHCASDKHIFNVNSDKDHQWNFRQPPWGQGSNLSLCSRHMDGGRCPYSHVPDMFNLCKYAHTQEELDEWNERFEWRQMKRTLAKEQNMFSYMEQLLERYNAADSRVTEISETLSGVQIDCDQPLVEFRQEKNTALVWSFTLQTRMTLERVALLHHSARLHFHLQTSDGSKHQIMAGDQCEDRGRYRVKVHFTGGMFGSYSQWVVFDFGTKPVLVRKLNVELGQKSVHDKVKDLRQKLAFDRWTGENRQVIPYQYTYDDFTLKLNQTYKEPSSEAVVTHDSVRELNQHNYVHKMHRLLELEEITRHKLISSFNMVIMAEVKEEMATEQQQTPFHSRHGELFLRLPLTDNLTEDTGAGQLILTSVRSVLLTRHDFDDKYRVYEALIEGKGKDYVFVSVSPVCVRELKLKAGMYVEVEVQFQINRMHFMNMHYALDALDNTDIVFPDISKINPAINEQHSLKISSRLLNQDQLKAVRHILAERTGYTPPFIMYGPFGTGKTETLAQAAMVLLRERHDARILICAQSNSAADLYITKHLDPFLRRSSKGNTILLRIVSKDRRLISIPEGSRKYCCYSPDGSSFEMPKYHALTQYRIVVTTVEMSLRLTSMNLKGAFTHIFIDEAAQALECETVMPLTLATDKTCVVLTGDHLQISPKVYSAEARRQNFGMSMLERLYEYYSNFSHQLQQRSVSNPLNIFLSINYRTKMEILRFISAVFYGGPDNLTAGGSIPSVVELTPLQFYAVLGREEQQPDSTSYVNLAECSEVVERVISLLDDWPREWGRVAPEEIGVISPYFDQVKQIRSSLKRHHRSDLRSVSVEPVQNIQGKEFRALFITTVRTRHLLHSKHVAKALIEAETVGGVTDFAFLSDRKLLNTALTRTKSLVAVVGDPLALCAIGECIQIWRTFLKHCNNMRSIRPSHMSYDNIKSQVVELQLSPIGQRLKEVTELCSGTSSPRSTDSSPPPMSDKYSMHRNRDSVPQGEVYVDEEEPTFSVSNGPTLGAGDGHSIGAGDRPSFSAFEGHGFGAGDAASLPASFSAPPPSLSAPPPSFSAPPPSLSAPPPSFSAPPPSLSVPPPAFTGLPSAFTAPPPVRAPALGTVAGPTPLAPLKRVPLKPLGKLKLTKPVIEEFKAADFPIRADEILLQLAREMIAEDVLLPLKVECIRVVEEEGQALVTYDPELANEVKRRKLLQAATAGKEFESDAEIYVDEDKDTKTVTKFYNYTEQTLQAVLHNEPDHYKRCIIHMKEDSCVAEVISQSDSVQEIEVNGLLHRGRAFDKDEVVVEVLPTAVDMTQGKPSVQGRVVGILQRAVDHQYRTFVCSADSTNTSLLIPVTPGTPCIYNVTLQKHFLQVKTGCVCVYRLSADKTLSFSHYEKVEAGSADNKLFVVRYLKWLPGFYHPLGVVVGIVPVGSTLTSAQKIVDIEHNVPVGFNEQVVNEVKSTFISNTLPAESPNTRMDLTQAWSFTIDSAQATDLQVAFSIDQVSELSYQVCVHITDVTGFVKSGSAMDKEAAQRGASLLPVGRDQVPMLPPRLSSELCSLVPGQDRRALSVFMTVAGNGDEWHVVQTSVRPSIINSKHRFSFQEVDRILDDFEGAENDYLNSCILVLFQIAMMQKKLRRGNAHLDPELGPMEMTAPRGHQIVQEVLIMANHQVAGQLLKAFPQCTPLLQQRQPNRQKLEVWRSQYAADAINSVTLTKPFLEGSQVCSCRMVCMCVFGYMRHHEVEPRSHFNIVSSVWQEMIAAAPQGLTHLIQKGVVSPLGHPQTLVARQALNRLLPQQRWVCSGDVDPLDQGHYSHNLPCLTDMTSPLRSYVSIVVLRLVWAMVGDQPCPYTQQDITQLMATANRTQHRVDSFTTADMRVQLAAALQSHPLTLFPVVEKVEEEGMRLCFPHLPCLQEQDCIVSFTAFGPSVPPSLSADADQVKLTVQERIYNTEGAKSGGSLTGVELCADRFVSFIPPFQWQKLLAAVREDDEQKQVATVMEVQGHVREASTDGRYVLDVSSEASSGRPLHQFTEFSLAVHTSMMVQAQVSAGVTRGVLAPQLQLVSLTPTLDVCVEHHRDPSSCFTAPGSGASIPNTCRDEAHYQQLWMPVLALEAAETAVCSGESAVVHNITIQWSNEFMGFAGTEAGVLGQFSLSQAFCKERHLFSRSQAHEELQPFGLAESIPAPMDLLCVRYKGVEMGGEGKVDSAVTAVMKVGAAGSWVGHCVVVGVKPDPKGNVTVRLRLLNSSAKVPPSLLDPSTAAQLACTVEVIPKPALFRQMEYSVACLTSASRLARDIAVGRMPVNNIDQSDVAHLLSKANGHLSGEQKEAVQMALKQPFTVIQGPPGCGKSRTAVQLACLFVQRNRMTPHPVSTEAAHGQVLMCASSDAVLDGLAAHLQLLGKACPRVVRVYDRWVEERHYPVPGGTTPPMALTVDSQSTDVEQQALGLHHLIRHPSSRFHQNLQKYDTLFSQFDTLVSMYPDSFADEQIQAYDTLVREAEVEELQQAEIILATCSAVASSRMAKGTNIKQIIVDSCESCLETESLLPAILMRSAQQVVLVGDPQQLIPAVRSDAARFMGLGRSLLQRYSHTAVSLSRQYRMFQGITEVTSKCFYQSGLRPSELGPGTAAQPLVFYHVMGQEEVRMAASGTAVVESVCNAAEAESVTCIVEDLVKKGVAAYRVVVLTQYSAQQHLIRKYLTLRHITSVAVHTVLQAQGSEFDFVVFSTCRSVSRSEARKAPTSAWLHRHLGVTADAHQMNTALTRAREVLIITGNKHLLQCIPQWRIVLDHCRERKSLIDAHSCT
ncbi:3'-5' exoribonuclease HELZ2-like isoform X2 [Babylonia areolata]|uniref:3'-5' exoribonuclease HELZ2-like isoform X2 n=1 Tax=Babylonia areolata TaxID=304850 RepID=UPI003FD1A1E2